MVKNLCFSHDVKLSPFLFIFFQSIQLNLFLKNLTSTKISGFFFFYTLRIPRQTRNKYS